jgi:2-haloacid dehalogenase
MRPGYSTLELPPCCRNAFRTLRDGVFTVWCFTSGDVQRVKGYFQRADLNIPSASLISCDRLGVAKPALTDYQHVWDLDAKWFADAHMWDVAAATRVGLRGAWSSVYEQEACLELQGSVTLEIVAGDLAGMA